MAKQKLTVTTDAGTAEAVAALTGRRS